MIEPHGTQDDVGWKTISTITEFLFHTRHCRGKLGNLTEPGEGRWAFWPASEGIAGAYWTTLVTDERNWITGLHGGARRICQGKLSAPEDEG